LIIQFLYYKINYIFKVRIKDYKPFSMILFKVVINLLQVVTFLDYFINLMFIDQNKFLNV